MEFLKNFKDLRKLGLQNIALYNAANVPFSAGFFPPTFTSSMLSAMLTEAKSRFGAALERSAHDCQTRVIFFE